MVIAQLKWVFTLNLSCSSKWVAVRANLLWSLFKIRIIQENKVIDIFEEKENCSLNQHLTLSVQQKTLIAIVFFILFLSYLKK